VIVAYLLRGFKIMYAISFAFFYLIYYLHSHAYSQVKERTRRGARPLCVCSLSILIPN